jgi:hypothetical protein
MPPGSSRRLVIDASIAHSAGESSANPIAKSCRDVLACVLSVSHRIVTTADILSEWDEHQSGYFRTWRVKMRNLRKIDNFEITKNVAIRVRIRDVTPDKGIVQAMLKDLRLIEAALASDHTIISLDEKVRSHFANAAILVDDLKSIVWVNPLFKKEKAIGWLKGGAKPDAFRLLGFRRK